MNSVKYFIITVDTEGDNLWTNISGENITTNNTEYIPRFQALCEKYGFKPVYLTNYEMVNDHQFVSFAKKWLEDGNCEIGVHLHAWNNPPFYELSGRYNSNPYLIEYPKEIMKEKFGVIYNLIKEKFGISPISHRAGRWAMNDDYFDILKEFDIKIDCSYTPGINWSSVKGRCVGGSDYSHIENCIYDCNGIFELPATIYKYRNCQNGSLKHRLKSLILGENVWFRTATSSIKALKTVIDKNDKNGIDYIEFMIHSSELMPGGSPYFKSYKDIENEYLVMDELFQYAKQKGYIGVTLQEFFMIKKTHK